MTRPMIHDYPSTAVGAILSHRYMGADFPSRTVKHESATSLFGTAEKKCCCDRKKNNPQGHPQGAAQMMLRHRYG